VLRGASVAAAGLGAAMIGGAGVVHATGGTTTVDAQDQNTWPPDATNHIEAVQFAVDDYDTVYLQGTFNFGEDGTVKIENSVKVFGEEIGDWKTGVGMTKIEGGRAPLQVLAPGQSVEIYNIHVNNAKVAGIIALKGLDITIAQNRVTVDTFKNRTITLPYYLPMDFGRNGYGILVGWPWGGLVATPDDPSDDNPANWVLRIEGNVTVEDNYVDLGVGGDVGYPKPPGQPGHDPYAWYYTRWFTCGVSVQTSGNVMTQENTTTIRRNISKNANTWGLLTADNFGQTIIENNEIIMAPHSSWHFGGIEVSSCIFISGQYIPGKKESIHASGNTIRCNDAEQGKVGFGVIEIGEESGFDTFSLTDNTVDMGENGYVGIGLLGVSDCFVGHNKVTGTGNAALGMIAAPPFTPADCFNNVFEGNNIAQFNGLNILWDLSYGADYNTHIGYSGEVAILPEGTDLKHNKITGYKAVAGGVGQAVADKLRELAKALSESRP
jgi:hypothetical protein